ncbi:Error-prone DNA polymerase [Streptomyces microflavus]
MGVHAAGVIMSSEPIVDHAPVWVRHTDGVTITQWDYPQCELLGLLKMDFLGLRNLTIMDDAIKMVKSNKGIDLEMLSLPLDDPETYELLCRVTRSASSSSTAGRCAPCCARCSPTTSRTSPPSRPSTGRARWA